MAQVKAESFQWSVKEERYDGHSFVSGVLVNDPNSVPPRHRDTNTHFANTHPTKRYRSENHSSPSKFPLPEGENNWVFQNDVLGTGGQAAEQGAVLAGENASGLIGQGHWHPHSSTPFIPSVADGVVSTEPCFSYSSTGRDGDVTLLPLDHYSVNELSVSEASSDSQLGAPWPFPWPSFPHVPQHTYSTAQSASAPSDAVLFPLSPPVPYSFSDTHCQASPVTYPSLPYDPNLTHQLGGSLSPPPQHGSAGSRESLDMAPAFSTEPRSLSISVPLSLEDTESHTPIGHFPRSVSFDTSVKPTESTENGCEMAHLSVPMDRDNSTEGFGAVTQDTKKVTRRQPKKRTRFDEVLRQQTSATRSDGACVRCRAQRIRCSPVKDNPEGPCEKCLRVNKNNKKTVHRIPCCRYKFTSMVFHRSEGLNYTRRFTHERVMDVGDHVDDIILDVEMAQGLCQIPVKLTIRRFKEREGDIINRRYEDENGFIMEQKLEPWCLADVEKTAESFKKYIKNNAIHGLEEAAKNPDEIVRKTFSEIKRQLEGNKRTEDDAQAEAEKEERKLEEPLRSFLEDVVRLWFAIRHETGSAWLCGSGKPPVPRMIVAQFDSIRHERIYKVLKPKVLKPIEKYICSGNLKSWFTLYLASFLLLHQVSCSSSDRQRWAKANTSGVPWNTRYGPIDHKFTSFVEDLHSTARSLLLYWQYFRRCDLMNIDSKKPGKTVLENLEPYQLKFMKETAELLKSRQKEGKIPNHPYYGCWEHELFWVSHLFGSPPSNDRRAVWEPPEGFTRAKYSVGMVRPGNERSLHAAGTGISLGPVRPDGRCF